MFRAARVEHGHTLGEHIIYEVLWRSATGNAPSRTITIGYDRLAAMASVNWKTARSCLKGLEVKLAIQTVAAHDSDQRIGRTYRVFSFTEILERRRKAGLLWVEKSRGVRFLQTGTVPDSTTVPDAGTAPLSTTVPNAGMVAPPETGTVTVPVTGTPLGIKKEEKKEEPSSSEVSQFQERAGTMIGMDDDAARAIIRDCRAHDSQATIEEIWHFCEQKILERARLKEPVGPGLLIAAVPRYFAQPASELRRLRHQTGRAAGV